VPQTHLLTARNFHVEYYEEHRRAGLDYLGHGEWQEHYGRWLVEVFGLRDHDVLDGGCAAGSIAYGFQKAGARAHGVDLNNHTIALGKLKFPVPLYVCDIVNLHLFGDNSFALVHTNHSARLGGHPAYTRSLQSGHGSKLGRASSKTATLIAQDDIPPPTLL